MKSTTAQLDRACGTLLGTATGDALGAGYEFDGPRGADEPIAMIGGGLGPFEPGEWTDDSSLAVVIAEVAATGADLREESTQDRLVACWHEWAKTAKDVGVQTWTVLSAAAEHGASAHAAREESAALHERTGRTAGNGSLMRTAPVALTYLDDEDGLATAARAISDLTHYDPDAGDACVLWCAAIRHAVLTGEIDVRVGLDHIDAGHRELWGARLDGAESLPPAAFADSNGWVVAALQAAWSAIVHTPVPVDDPAKGMFSVDHLRLVLETAVRGGGDTDTVAAIAGGLLGAAYGASAVPADWREMLHGWPGLTARGLVGLATTIFRGGEPENVEYPDSEFPQADTIVRCPHDDRVLVGGVNALQQLPDDVDAIVSLCRVPDDYLPAGVRQLDVRLIDEVDENAHLDFVLLDTVRAVEHLHAKGHTVFIHCVEAHSRTPTVAALYGARKRGVGTDQALNDLRSVLPEAHPNPDFRAALHRLHPEGLALA